MVAVVGAAVSDSGAAQTRMAGYGDDALNLAAFAELLGSAEAGAAAEWRPSFVRLDDAELAEFQTLCHAHAVALHDPIGRQLAELAAARLPAGPAAARAALVEEIVDAAGGATAVGNWVYLPWLARVVHLLGRDAYFEVITNRNRDKITAEEQLRLRARCVGVLGLSVGGEIAVAIAQEHLCGRMVIADFDELDLSNLNRLGAGFDDLGRNKAIIVARRIVRIDPYIDLTVLPDGVTAETLAGFLDGLDLLIEECDSLGLKHDIRLAAKQRRLNVVYAADERGFLSVEPYALWPELAVFHGRIAEAQPAREAYPSARAFFRALTEWLGGWDGISARSRRSLEQVGTVLCGYPQLAGEARYAAGQITHVARRLLLGERLPPFVGQVDLDELLPTSHR
ncbi:MAG: ThiF family adenylyltransferase [Longimicrobiales bacterium]